MESKLDFSISNLFLKLNEEMENPILKKLCDEIKINFLIEITDNNEIALYRYFVYLDSDNPTISLVDTNEILHASIKIKKRDFIDLLYNKVTIPFLAFSVSFKREKLFYQGNGKNYSN